MKPKVLLNIEDYNRLRNFKKGIVAGHTYKVCFGPFNQYREVFIGTDEALREIGQKLEEKQKEIDELNKLGRKEIKELKTMSWWEFIKWKASIKK